jgi:hypothetical protein
MMNHTRPNLKWVGRSDDLPEHFSFTFCFFDAMRDRFPRRRSVVAVVAARHVVGRRALPQKNPPPSSDQVQHHLIATAVTTPTPLPAAAAFPLLPKNQQRLPIPIRTWLNPWADLVELIPPADLSQRVFAYTQLWGVLCTASVTTLLGFPHAPDPIKHDCHRHEEEPGEPLLAMLIPPARLHDFYIGTSLLSFFSGGIALGVATVTNITGFLVPQDFLVHFVRRHSLLLGSLPGLTVVSGGLLGMSVVSGVDMEDRGGPLSKLAVFGYVFATLFIGATSLSGHSALVRGIARAKRRLLP